MLQITDPGIPNGLTQNLGGLVQALIERRDKDRQFDLEQQKIDAMGSKGDGSLAEAIRNHDLMAGYRDRIASATEKRADTGVTNADERGRHNVATEATSESRAAETGRHDQATEAQAGANADDKNENADLGAARAIHDSWMNSQFRPPTPQQESDHFHATLDAVKARRTQKPAAGAPAPAAAPNPAMAPNAPVAPPMAPGAPVPGPAAPPSTSQIQLKHRASQWISLPSLSDSDKQKVQQAIQSNNFDALARMESKLQQTAPGPSAR